MFLTIMEYIFFSTKNPKIELVDRKQTKKATFFCKVGTRVLAIVEVEKVVLWTFSKFFGSCLGSFWLLFCLYSLVPVTVPLLCGPVKPF